jgi:hypothetical protein
MSEPRKEWNLPLTYWQTEGLPLPLASFHATSSWNAVLFGKIVEHLLPKRARAVRMGQGHFLADLTLG